MRRAKSEWCRSLSGTPDRAVHLRAVPRPPQVPWPQVQANEDGLVPPQLGRAGVSAAVDIAARALGYTSIRAMTHQHCRCAVAPGRISKDEDDNEAPCGKHLMPGPCTTWNHVDNLCCVLSGRGRGLGLLDHNVRRTFARPLLVRVSGYSSARLAGSGPFSFFCGLSALGVLCSSKRFCEVAERADVAVDPNGKFPARPLSEQAASTVPQNANVTSRIMTRGLAARPLRRRNHADS